MKRSSRPAAIAALLSMSVGNAVADPPVLPEASGTVSIPAQEWPFQPGPREIAVHIRYPGERRTLAGVGPRTGLMLSLHNWGGTGFSGTADPDVLAARYDVVAIGVDYLQSGKKASVEDPEPYDFGYLQALDALRALHFVFDGLKRRGIAFDGGRIFTTGGSGGGNVSLMANKLAPRTFAAVIDLCGMKRLSDDIAFGLPGGSPLNARYSREPGHPHFLSPGRQELHFLGHPGHLAAMRALGASARIVSVHGAEDATCPAADADAFAAAARAAGLEIDYVRVTADRLDGKVFTSAGHPLGNRTEIVHLVAGELLDPESPRARRREGATDFERGGAIRYPVAGGAWVIDFAKGYPVGRFEAAR